MGRGLILGLFFSASLFIGACAHHADSTTAASTDGAHQCAADCKHDKNHQCSAECKHDKGHACSCKQDKAHQCSADCKAHKGATNKAGACDMHANHDHEHGATCGHKTVKHGDHMDYMHDGHQHAVHGDHVDEHKAKKAETTKTSPTKS